MDRTKKNATPQSYLSPRGHATFAEIAGMRDDFEAYDFRLKEAVVKRVSRKFLATPIRAQESRLFLAGGHLTRDYKM